MLIGLPTATPKEFMNSASYAFGNLDNSECSATVKCALADHVFAQSALGPTASRSSSASSRPSGPSVRIVPPQTASHPKRNISSSAGAFDSTLHISEEAANANIAVPWAMISACSIASIFGFGARCLTHLEANFYGLTCRHCKG